MNELQRIKEELLKTAQTSGELHRIKQAFTTKRKATPISKKWSRKGECPFCGVQTGSNHSADCQFEYTDGKSLLKMGRKK